MSDLISRSALKKYMRDYKWEFALNSDFSKAIEMVDVQPTIEAVPVVHVEWKLKQGDEGVHWYCSKCREEALFDILNYQEKSNFCPNCGADMRKGGANQ